MRTKREFNEKDILQIEPFEKLGIYATVNPDGLPHLTFVNSLIALGKKKMAFGQFIRGESKYFMQQNNKLSFFILSPHVKKMWLGKALWKEKKYEGPELEKYKNIPLQRYNSYFPIYMVHYLDLVETTGGVNLPIFRILSSTIINMIFRHQMKTNIPGRVLKHYSESLVNKLSTLAFISFIGTDGFPAIVPFVQCKTSDSRRIVFSPFGYKNEMKALTEGRDVAVFCLNTTLESVLIRGKFNGYKRILGVELGIIDIEWVYNSMPPNAGQIYPEITLEPIRDF